MEGLAATIAGPATNGATMVYGNGEGQNTSHYYDKKGTAKPVKKTKVKMTCKKKKAKSK